MTVQDTLSPTVWVVDDHPNNAEAVADIARGLGLRARTFSSAEQAVAALAGCDGTAGCDVLVTDLRLAGMDGFGLIDHVRGRMSRTPVALVTAYGSPDAEARARAVGAELLVKPLSIEDVEALLARLVSRGRE